MPPSSNNPNRCDIKIPVQDLRIGMFVSGLDRDWLETPFKLQGFYIREQSDIDQIKEYCKHVYVLGIGKAVNIETVDFESGELIGRKPTKYPITSKLEAEFKEIKNIAGRARVFVERMLTDVRAGQGVSIAHAKEVVLDSVESVIRHPDAAMFLTKLRGQDDYTAEHCMNVCMLSIVFGRRLGMRKNQLINLGLCGLLHDAGKARIPLEILNKRGRLNEEEFQLMKKHTTFGKELLSEKGGVYQGAIDVAYSHHERPDGRGYPRGLASDDIGLLTRIVSVVDAYDAITADRVYAKGRPSTEALRIIFEGAGQQFDRKLALAFIQTIGIYPPGVVVELINGKVGIVVDVAESPRHLPTVLVVLDENKQLCEHQYIDLAGTIDGSVDTAYLIRFALADGCYGISVKTLFHQGIFEHLNH